MCNAQPRWMAAYQLSGRESCLDLEQSLQISEPQSPPQGPGLTTLISGIVHMKPKDVWGQLGYQALARGHLHGEFCVCAWSAQLSLSHTSQTTCSLCSTVGRCLGKIMLIGSSNRLVGGVGITHSAKERKGAVRLCVCGAMATAGVLSWGEELGNIPLTFLRYLFYALITPHFRSPLYSV